MILHVTHNDLDGVGCSILIKKCYDFVETFYLNYDEVDSFIQNNYHRYNQIIITDISPNEETFNFIENHLEIVFIDHHKTSLHLSDRYFAFIDTTKSATMLTYEWLTQSGFNLQSYKDLVDCINDFDMWHLKRDDSLKMNMLFSLMGLERFEKRFIENPDTSFTEKELFILEIETESMEKYLKQAEKAVYILNDNGNRRFGVIFAEKYNSELGHHIIKKIDLDYVIIINIQKKKISLRSKPEIDISILASKNGGGGHKNAAGFSTKFDFCLQQFLKEIGVL